MLAGRSRDEERAVQSEMSRLNDPEVQSSNPFWADGARARAFALLRLRVERVPAALKYCQRVLGGIHADFFPLEVVPSSFEKLCHVFSQPEELRRVMDHQIRAGARAALGLVHIHWPGVDFSQVVAGPPGGGDHPMNEHYMAVDKPACQVVRRVCEENDRHLGSLIKERWSLKIRCFPLLYMLLLGGIYSMLSCFCRGGLSASRLRGTF